MRDLRSHEFQHNKRSQEPSVPEAVMRCIVDIEFGLVSAWWVHAWADKGLVGVW